MKADYLVVSCSLNPDSKSRHLAVAAEGFLKKQKARVETIDLREWPLPLCDGAAAYGDPRVGRLTEKVAGARCVLFSAPIYNFDVSAAAKNLVEWVGGALEDKAVGFLCAAGGQGSYMSVMSFASSLMLDFRCLILPRFVYATGKDFGPKGIEDAEILKRIEQLAGEAVRITSALGFESKPAETAAV